MIMTTATLIMLQGFTLTEYKQFETEHECRNGLNQLASLAAAKENNSVHRQGNGVQVSTKGKGVTQFYCVSSQRNIFGE